MNFKDITTRDELDCCLKKDIKWAIAIAFQSDNNGALGSWTDFNRQVNRQHSHKKNILEYLPVIPQPQEYPVCKHFLEHLLELLKDLEIDHIFAHSDEKVYACLCDIIWKEPTRHQAVIFLMGSFHQLRVRQIIVFKQRSITGYRK